MNCALMATLVTRLGWQDRCDSVKLVTAMVMSIRMLWATVTERLASASNVSIILEDRGVISVSKVGQL